jgi:hypothetical protein
VPAGTNAYAKGHANKFVAHCGTADLDREELKMRRNSKTRCENSTRQFYAQILQFHQAIIQDYTSSSTNRNRSFTEQRLHNVS